MRYTTIHIIRFLTGCLFTSA